jgi:hypothetical protein
VSDGQQAHMKKFTAGFVLVVLAMLLYSVERVTGVSASVLGLIWWSIPASIGGTLMLPKLFPNLYNRALETVTRVFGKFTVTP